MRAIQTILAMLGRICLSLIFILAAINMIMNWQTVEQNVTERLHAWMTYTQGVEWAQSATDMLLDWTTLLVACAVLFKLIGGLLVLIGYKVRFGAFLLLLFIIPTTIVFHDFWNMDGSDRELQMTMFLKNLSMIGGLLLLLAYGKGICKEPAPEKPPLDLNE